MRKYLTEDKGWVNFYKKFNTSLYIEKAGYFDERPQLHISLTQIIMIILFPFLLSISFWFIFTFVFLFIGWGKMYISLPIKTGIQDCDSAAWGFDYHDNTVWFYIGGGGNFQGGKKWKTITMPWNLEWYRTSLLLKDETWVHEFKGKKQDFLDEKKWKDKRWEIKADYLDKHDNTIIESKINVSEREWRRKGLMKIPLVSGLFNSVRKSIEIEFSKEVGERKGSWKGGVMSRNERLDEGEDILEALEKRGFSSLSYKRDSKIDQILGK